MGLKEKAKALKNKLAAIFLALKHKKTPAAAKIMASITIGYAFSPIDFIPDFIPVLGYLDDIILLPLFISITIKLIPRDVMEECESNAQNLWKDGKPRKWYYGIPIVLIWVAIISFILYKIFSK